jgi:hypothetical protein
MEDFMKLNFSNYFCKAFCVLVIALFVSCDQPTDPTPTETTPPVPAKITLTLESDSTETVDATHPIRWEVSTIHNFSSIVKTGTQHTADPTTIDIEVAAGSYFVRAYIDNDNNGL